MTHDISEATTIPPQRPKPTDLERRVLAHEHSADDGRGTDHVQVAERHGIWTVTKEGAFVGDYHEPEVAHAAAAQARMPLPTGRR
jgi:hypothetical protein